jgi:UDP-N-acetylmuramyl tripeptide synthase
VILILGKGDEEYQIIYDKKFSLNDKKIVEEINK